MAVKLIANWAPLEGRLAPEPRAEFMPMHRESGVRHADAGRLLADTITG